MSQEQQCDKRRSLAELADRIERGIDPAVCCYEPSEEDRVPRVILELRLHASEWRKVIGALRSVPSHERDIANAKEAASLGYPDKIIEGIFAPSTTPRSSETPRMNAALGRGADWVFAKGCQLERELADHKEVLADKRRLARELDVAMHGEEGAAKQASLCDLIPLAKALREKASVASAIEQRRWDLVRLWLTQDGGPRYIPGIHQARSIEAVNEAVDRALHAADGGKQT